MIRLFTLAESNKIQTNKDVDNNYLLFHFYWLTIYLRVIRVEGDVIYFSFRIIFRWIFIPSFCAMIYTKNGDTYCIKVINKEGFYQFWPKTLLQIYHAYPWQKNASLQKVTIPPSFKLISKTKSFLLKRKYF